MFSVPICLPPAFGTCLLALLVASGAAFAADGAATPAAAPAAATAPPAPAALRSEEYQAIECLTQEAYLDENNDRLADAYGKFQEVSQFYETHPEFSNCRNGCTCQRIYVEEHLGYIARLWRRSDEAIAHYRKAIARIGQPGPRHTMQGDIGVYYYLAEIHGQLALQGKRGLVSQVEAEMAVCEERIQTRLLTNPQALETAKDNYSRSHGCLVLDIRASSHFLRGEFAQAQQAWNEKLVLARKMKLTRDEAHALLGQADLAATQDDYEKALTLIDEALELPPHPGCNRCQPEARTQRALYRARRDGFQPQDIEEADAAVAQLDALGIGNHHERLMRAKILALAGRGAEGMAEGMAEAEAVRLKVQEIGLRLLEAEAICTKASIAGDLGTFCPELGGQLQEALLLYREMGYKIMEPFVCLDYGSWLAQNGQTTQALYVLNQGLRFCTLFNFPTLTARTLAVKVAVLRARGDSLALTELEKQLDAYLQTHPDLPPATRRYVAATRGKTLENASIDNTSPGQDVVASRAGTRLPLAGPGGETPAWIQPMQAESVCLGDAAQTRFSLQNLVGVPVSGRLGFRGAVIKDHHWKGDELWIDLLPVAAADSASVAELPVTLAADRLCWIALATTCPDAETTGKDVDIFWNGEQQATWSIGGLLDQDQIRVTNSGLFHLGPFVQIPVAHLVFNPLVAQTLVNLRVITSSRCRVEFVDAASGRLLGVDATGNGSFADPGDDLWNDSDADGFPDLLLPARPTLGVIELWLYPYLQPGKGPAEELIEVNLFLRHGGDWEKQALDHVFTKPD